MATALTCRSLPYAKALVTAALHHLTVDDISAIEPRHIAFATYCLRYSRGDRPATIDRFLRPAREAHEIDAALEAFDWLKERYAEAR